MMGLLDLLKRLGTGSGDMAGGAGRPFTGMEGLKQEEVTAQPPNLHNAIQSRAGGHGGSYAELARTARRTGEIPGQQLSMGPAGANYNQRTPEPMPFPQQSAADTPSPFANFDRQAFGKRLGQLGAGWAAGRNFNESVSLGNMALDFGAQEPDERLRSLLWLMQQR